MFPLVGPLPSTNSADSSSLFARFIGTMGPSDSPTLYTPVLRTYLHRPVRPSLRADGAGVSRFSSMKLHVSRVPVTPPGPTAARLSRRSRFCHPLGTTKAAPGNRFFRSSIARLALLCQRFASLLTRTRRMTRGRGGWLALPRTALSSAVSCRFIPTLSVPPSFRKRGLSLGNNEVGCHLFEAQPNCKPRLSQQKSPGLWMLRLAFL